MAFLGLSTQVTVVFGLIAIALILFVSELIPNDVTAIGGASVIAEGLVAANVTVPLVGVLLLTSLLTGVIANSPLRWRRSC